jgi:hypothetical protein
MVDTDASKVERRTSGADTSGMGPEANLLELLKSELATAEAELRAHMASWEYAFAMGSSADGARNHPMHQKTRENNERLVIRCRDLRARLAEHEV